MADSEATNYQKAQRSLGRPDVANTFATLALADAINALHDDVIAELVLVRDELRLLRGEPLRR
jgi:hypothetical protein